MDEPEEGRGSHLGFVHQHVASRAPHTIPIRVEVREVPHRSVVIVGEGMFCGRLSVHRRDEPTRAKIVNGLAEGTRTLVVRPEQRQGNRWLERGTNMIPLSMFPPHAMAKVQPRKAFVLTTYLIMPAFRQKGPST